MAWPHRDRAHSTPFQLKLAEYSSESYGCVEMRRGLGVAAIGLWKLAGIQVAAWFDYVSEFLRNVSKDDDADGGGVTAAAAAAAANITILTNNE